MKLSKTAKSNQIHHFLLSNSTRHFLPINSENKEGDSEAAGDEGNAKVSTGDGRSGEATRVQAGDGGTEGDSQALEERRASHQKASLPEACVGNCPGIQDGYAIPELCHRRPPEVCTLPIPFLSSF
jgi:hypothetical protein